MYNPNNSTNISNDMFDDDSLTITLTNDCATITNTDIVSNDTTTVYETTYASDYYADDIGYKEDDEIEYPKDEFDLAAELGIRFAADTNIKIKLKAKNTKYEYKRHRRKTFNNCNRI